MEKDKLEKGISILSQIKECEWMQKAIRQDAVIMIGNERCDKDMFIHRELAHRMSIALGELLEEFEFKLKEL